MILNYLYLSDPSTEMEFRVSTVNAESMLVEGISQIVEEFGEIPAHKSVGSIEKRSFTQCENHIVISSTMFKL